MLLAVAEKLFEEREPSKWTDYYRGGDTRPGVMDVLFESVQAHQEGRDIVAARDSVYLLYRELVAVYEDYSPNRAKFDALKPPVEGLSRVATRLHKLCSVTDFALTVMGLKRPS
jgi:hypothetical protein